MQETLAQTMQQTPGQVTVLSQVTVLFALALGFALLIERLLEILKASADLVDSRLKLDRFWTNRAERVKAMLERRMRVYEYLSPDRLRAVLNRAYDLLLRTGEGMPGPVPVISGDLVRAAVVKTGCKLVGAAVGIWIAFQLEIDFVSLWPSVQGSPLTLSDKLQLVLPEELRWGLSGAAIGLGAGPVHKIITTIERKRAARETATGAA